MFLGKGVLKICRKATGEHPCRSVISIKLPINFIEIALRHGCSPVTFLHIFSTPCEKVSKMSNKLIQAGVRRLGDMWKNGAQIW